MGRRGKKNTSDLIQLDNNHVEISNSQTSAGLTGMKKWVREYNEKIIPLSQLKEDIQNFMEKFEEEEERKKKEELNGEEPDEEGWIKVTRKKGKRAGAPRTERMDEEMKAKKMKFEKNIMNSTPRQIKETRAQQLDDLKKKFIQDKERISVIKQQNQRKFKPI